MSAAHFARFVPLVLPALLLGGAAHADKIRGNGRSTTETRQVTSFDKLSVASGIKVEVKVGPLKALELRGDDNVLPVVETVVKGGRLSIRFERGSSIWNSGEVLVRVQVPALREVSASGGAEVKGELSKVEELDLSASGGGQLYFTGVEARELSVELSGGAEAELRGAVDRMELDFSGGAQIHGKGLTVRELKVEGSGGCGGVLNVKERAKGGLSGGCDLKIKGDPRGRIAVSGGSDVDYDD